MADPRERGAAPPLPTLGEGCTRRFDPQRMTDLHGADFSAAAELWGQLHDSAQLPPEPAAEPPAVPR